MSIDMYYSSSEIPSGIANRAEAQDPDYEVVVKKPKRRLYVAAGLMLALVVAVVWWHGVVQQAVDQVNQSTVAAAPSASPTPEPEAEVAGVTFGDLINQKKEYQGWLAGVSDGSIIITNPDSGEMNTVLTAKNEWHGPISSLLWSPDYTKLAFVVMPEAEAEGFSQNPVEQVKKLGLTSVPSASAFPYGYVAILDVQTKKLTRTSVEVKNVPQNIVWKNESTLFAAGNSLSELSLAKMEVEPLSEAGVSDEKSQIMPPLAWDDANRVLYFTRAKQVKDKTIRNIVGLSVDKGEVKELNLAREGDDEKVMTSSGISLAMSPDNTMLGVISDDGLSYLSLPDGGSHQLPYKDEWLWMRESVLSNAEWVSTTKLGFESMSTDGSKVWGVWDIESEKVHTFGRGSLSASWDDSRGRLALALSSGDELGVLTPNWEKPEDSKIELLDLPWRSLSW